MKRHRRCRGEACLARAGRPRCRYPGGEGEITHVYTEVGSVTLTVDAYWSGTWSAGGQAGDLPELATPTTADLDLPVEQRQAVIDPG